MNIKEDYIHFRVENNALINTLKEKQSLTYDYLSPVFLVLDYVAEKNLKIEGEEDEDVIDMFSTGFHYIFSAILNINNILKEHFEDDDEELLKFDQNLYLYLRADDIDTMLDSSNDMVSAILDRLSETLEYHKTLDKSIVETIEEELGKAQEEADDVTTIDQFLDFADILNIDII